MSTKLSKINIFISYEDIAERLGLEDATNICIGEIKRDNIRHSIDIEVITPRDNIIDDSIQELADKSSIYRIQLMG